jgi:membrane associated rhomboid family serine protease
MDTVAGMKDLSTLTQGAPAAAAILAAMVIASLLALYKMPSILERHLLRPYWLLPQRQYATVITSGFLHADLPHLLFNAFTFWAFGFSLERAIGTTTFVALYAFGLLVSSAGTWIAHRHQRDYASLGASGAILAVLFASIVHTPSQSIFILPIPVPIPAPLFALLYLAYTIYASRQPARGRINHDAHLSGALAGIVFVLLTDPGAFGRALRQVFG